MLINQLHITSEEVLNYFLTIIKLLILKANIIIIVKDLLIFSTKRMLRKILKQAPAYAGGPYLYTKMPVVIFLFPTNICIGKIIKHHHL